MQLMFGVGKLYKVKSMFGVKGKPDNDSYLKSGDIVMAIGKNWIHDEWGCRWISFLAPCGRTIQIIESWLGELEPIEK